MRLKEKDIQGIFKYDPDVTYTKGDFVVFEQKLYVVLATVTGVNPGSQNGREYYKVYLKDEVLDYEDVKGELREYLKSGKDKLISAFGVGKLLSSFMMGINDKGVITSEILESGDVSLRDYFGDKTDLGYINPLDEVMSSPDLNNATFRVSSEISKSILGSPTEAILRQYTYKSGNEDATRVQELLDPTTGLIKYRYATKGNGYSPTTNTWIGGNVGSDISSMINTVMSYYSDKAQEYDRSLYSLIGSFRFRQVDVDFTNVTIPGEEGRSTLEIPITKFPKFFEKGDYMVTLGIVIKERPTYYKTSSLTINLKDEVTYSTMGIEVSVDYSDGSNIVIETTGGAMISDIYYKQDFEYITDVREGYRFIKDLSISRETSQDDGLDYYTIDLSELSTNSGYVILESKELFWEPDSTGNPQCLEFHASPMVIDLSRVGPNNIVHTERCESGYSFSSGYRPGGKNPPKLPRSTNIRWRVSGDTSTLVLRQSILGLDGEQDVGGSSVEGAFGRFEEITKAYYVSI